MTKPQRVALAICDRRANVAMPEALYEKAFAAASSQYITLNSYVRSALAEKLQRDGVQVGEELL